MGHLNPVAETALPPGCQAPARGGREEARHVALVREVARPQFGMPALTGVPSATVWASPDGAHAGHRASPTAPTPGGAAFKSRPPLATRGVAPQAMRPSNRYSISAFCTCIRFS